MKSESEIKDLGYYLSGQAEYEDVVYETNIPNAYIVPCCNLLENPSALLEDARFAELLDKLAEQYRYVINSKSVHCFFYCIWHFIKIYTEFFHLLLPNEGKSKSPSISGR